MTWFLTRKLKRISKDADPDPRFVRALELKIREEINPIPTSLRWKTAAVSLVTASTMLVGMGGYAYTSDNVLPGHSLYPVRETIEHVEARVAWNRTMRTNVRLKQLHRRVREQNLLRARRKAQDARHIQRYFEAVEHTITESRMLDPVARESVDEEIIRVEESRIDTASSTEPVYETEIRQIFDREQEQIRRRLQDATPEERERLLEYYESTR